MTSYTSTELLESIRNTMMASGVQASGTDDPALLRHLNEAMIEKIVPWLIGVREDFLTISREYTLSISKVPMPTRAAYDGIRDVMYQDLNGNRYTLPRIPREHLPSWRSNTAGAFGETPSGFFLEDEYIVLVPDKVASMSGKLEVSFFFRPGDIVSIDEVRQITAVDTATNTITLDSDLPSTWTSANKFDIHDKDSGASIRNFDYTGTLGSNTLITDQPIDGSTYGSHLVEVGDYLCLAGQAALPAIPLEMQPLLIKAACCRILQAKGDIEKYQMFKSDLDESMQFSIKGLQKRAKGKPFVVSGRKSPLWQGRRSRFGVGY